MQSGNGLVSSTEGKGPPPLPGPFAARFAAAALAGEKIVAWLETDLDLHLHYAKGLVVLTDRRLLSFGPVNGQPIQPGDVQTWSIGPDKSLQAEERGGVGSLELFAGQTRL